MRDLPESESETEQHSTLELTAKDFGTLAFPEFGGADAGG
ncbi:hypothetical protein FHY18_002626 [Xanthomonas arboricola]|nr:hypothetical protein [Xanthomonas sp. 3793]